MRSALPTSEGTVRIGLGSSRASEDLQSVRRHLLPLPVTEIHRVLDAVSEQWGTSAAPPPDARSLTPSEFVQLAASKVVTIGAHTVDHVRLRGLPAADQLQTISSSRKELERLSGQAISHFAYPYGGPDSFDDHSVDAVRSAGFETACTTIPGNARPTSDPLPPPAPHGHELGSPSLQGGPGSAGDSSPGTDLRASAQRTMSPLRVAMVCSRYPPYLGGVETHVNEVARRIAARGLDLTVLTTDLTGELPPVEHEGPLTVRRYRCVAQLG